MLYRLAECELRVPNCLFIAIRLSHRRYSPSGDSSKRILVVGCSELKLLTVVRAPRAQRWVMPKSWGDKREGSHQKGRPGSACANAGSGGDARHCQRDLLLAVMISLRRH